MEFSVRFVLLSIIFSFGVLVFTACLLEWVIKPFFRRIVHWGLNEAQRRAIEALKRQVNQRVNERRVLHSRFWNMIHRLGGDPSKGSATDLELLEKIQQMQEEVDAIEEKVQNHLVAECRRKGVSDWRINLLL